VAEEGSLSRSMEQAVKHYSSLFKLPSYKKVVLFLALACVCGGLFSTVIIFPSTDGLVNGLFLGVSLLCTNLIIDYVVSAWVLSHDPIYDLRRTAALSMFCWALWLFFIFVGVAVEVPFGLPWWVRLCLLGFSAVLIFRLVVLGSTSSVSYKRLLPASLLQPLSCIFLFMTSWTSIGYPVGPHIFLFLIFSLALGAASSFFFIFLLNREGEQTVGVPSLSLLKAFLLNWVADLNIPFERFLEELGQKQDVEVSLIKFDSSKLTAVIAVPSIHPGPFKNIGSSLLPSMLKTALEKELNGVVCVPHGLLGHEFDLASQLQSQKIINRVVEFANFEALEARATPFVKVSNESATACCQIFGKSVFLSFSLAPKTTEDLPQELGLFVRQEAEKHGLTCCVVVNAHNSIDGAVNMQEGLVNLKSVARTCLERAISLRPLPFEVGAATIILKEFSLKHGIGPGGITVLVVKVGEQKTAYVVIDGNNMIAGLREKILSALRSIGIDESEVFTTDTHSVNAVVLNERGYHPVGEAIDHEKLIGRVKEATLTAMSDLERVNAACRRITVPGVKVIGGKLLETLCVLIDRTLQRAKKVVIPIFATSGLILMLFLVFF
jgi:putative membrane protein